MKISGYRVIAPLAKGGTALVYRAMQESLDRPVALKVLSPVFADDPSFTQRFLNEARIVASLQHPNIVTVFDFGVSEHFHYIAMELVDGGALTTRIKSGLDDREALAIVRTTASALGYAHSQGVIHRDVKPGNILFREDGTLLLSDFGIAKQLQADTDMTMLGTTVGSPSYLSPEQARCRAVDGRSDIYSLGIILYEMLTGERPFRAHSQIELIEQHLRTPPPKITGPLAIYNDLLGRMLAKEPDKRIATTDALCQELIGLHERRESGPAQSRRPTRAAKSVLVGAALGVAGVAIGVSVDNFRASPPAAGHQDNAALSASPGTATNTSQTADVVPPQPAASADPKPTVATDEEANDVTQPSIDASVPAAPTKVAAPAQIDPDATDTTAAPQRRVSQRFDPAEPFVNEPTERVVHIDDTESEAFGQPRIDLAQAPVAAAPAVTKSTQATKDEQISSLLGKAEAAFSSYQLTTPADDNAHAYFTQVLSLEPDNESALEGQRRIANRYAALARKQLTNRAYARAERHVTRGLGVLPKHPELLTLDKLIRRERDQAKIAAEQPAQRKITHVSSATRARKDAEAPSTDEARSHSEIQGEHPVELFRRIKGWFD